MEITQPKTHDGKGETSILNILLKYVRFWKWFAASVAACLALGVLFLMSKDVQYKVSLCAMLNEEKSSSTATDTQLEALGIHATVNNIENEIVILHSPDLMAQVVKALHLEASYYVKNLFGRKSYLYNQSPYHVVFTPGNENELRKIDLIIRQNNSIYIVDGNYVSTEAVIAFQEELRELPAVISLPDNAGTLAVHATGKTSPSVCFVDINNARSVANALASELKIEPTSNTSSVLKIDLRINNPEKGADVLEELVRQYNESSSNEKKKRMLGMSAFIGDRLNEISLELRLVEDDVVEYKQKNKIVDLNSETELYMQQTGEYERQKTDAETQLRIVGMVDRFVQENPLDEPIPSLGVNDPELSQAISEYNTNVATYEQLLKSASENNPSRRRLEKNLVTARNRIMSLIRTERESVRIALANINRQESAMYSRIQSVPLQEKGLLEMGRQQKVIENLFLYLMQKREETNVAMASAVEKAKVVVSPTNGGKVYPSNKQTLALFMFFGLAFPIVFVFLAEIFRTTVGDVFELKRLTRARVIGEIGYANAPVVVRKETSSYAAEQFRMLRNNIDYHFAHERHKIVLVTSSVHNEGKTFVSINLAMAFALLDRRVLLVDTDMRRANLGKYLHSKSQQGLTDYLAGNALNWGNAIEYTNHFPLLHILKAGTTSSNPNELLKSDRFKDFIDEARAAYDCVILDSPPAGLAPDAFVVAEYVDMTLFVVREKLTSKAAAAFLDDDKYLQLNNLHLVYNGMTAPEYGSGHSGSF